MLQLYSTAGCHLCEEAEALLVQARAARPNLSWEVVDIADEDALFEKYGWLIPVLHVGTSEAPEAARGTHPESGQDAVTEHDAFVEQELRWPFDAAMLDAFLAVHGDALAGDL